MPNNPRILFLITEDWYFWSHRLPIARAAKVAGFDILVATNIKQHGHLIEQEGFRLIQIKLKRKSYNPFMELLAIIDLICIYKRERPTIAHHVAMKPVLYGSIASWIAKIPYTVNALAGLGHTFVSKKTSTSILRFLIKKSFRILLNRTNSCVILQNPDDADALIQNSVVQPRLIRMIKGSGVDLKKFELLPEYDAELIVILPSRMLWEKGIDDFVHAAEILKKKNIQARFVLVGRIDEESPSSIPLSQLKKWNDIGVVEWWGHCDNMPDVFARSHIVCLPTFYGEGVPKSLIEAAACGRPIITTDIPGCREIVREGVNGLLVPIKNVDALANAIQLLIENPDMRHEMGTRGREIVVKEFSEEKVINETLSVYKELLVQ